MTEIDTTTPFGPTGRVVYERTYSRKKPNGENETWPETVRRVATGNLALVHGTDMNEWPADALNEWVSLVEHMLDFRIIPAGRHLWASGVKGRQYLFNCHVAGWGEKLSRHFEFTFLRLMEGGGVGSNYSSEFLKGYGSPRRPLRVHIVCDPGHPDYDDMVNAGLLSAEYDSDWEGSFEVEDSREGWAAALVDLIDTAMTDDEVRHQNRVYDVSRVRGKGSRLKTFGGTASGPAPFARMMSEVGRVLSVAALRKYPQRYALGMDPAATGHLHLAEQGGQSIYAKDSDHGIGHSVLVETGDRRIFMPNALIEHNGQELTFTPRPAPAPAFDHLTPIEAMEIDHAIAECVVSGGNRRSARMAMVAWDDPFIHEFLACKRDGSKHWTTNISVVIDNEFAEYVQRGEGYRTGLYPDHRQQLALDVHHEVVEGMLTNGEPGYWHRDNANVGEPNPVIATNPCGEIALEAWENCNLGHVNLDAFAPTGQAQSWAAADLADAHRLMTRFLMRATYGDVNDPAQAETLARNRRIGVGHLGVQGYLVKNGIRYSDASRSVGFIGLLRYLSDVVDEEAIAYAHALRIPVPVKSRTVAPTGSIAKLPGVTEGIHPIYARHFDRRVRFSMTDDDQAATVWEASRSGLTTEKDSYDPSGNTWIVVYPTKDQLVAEAEALGRGDLVEAVDEISLDDMLAFQSMYQQHWADNAVSFTVNVAAEQHQNDALLADPFSTPPPATADRVNTVAQTLADWLPSLKGTTVMLDGSRRQAPYTRITEAEYEAASVKSVEDGTDEECTTGACPVR